MDSPFCGSSASSAHVAGHYALLLSAFLAAQCRAPGVPDLQFALLDEARGTPTDARGGVPDVAAAVDAIYASAVNFLDDDDDHVNDSCDNCRDLANSDQEDFDSDGVGDTCDLCPEDKENGCEINEPSGDTDGDGIPDGTEAVHGTDPLNADTDNDGFGDLEELRGEDGKFGTPDDMNPLVSDADPDGDGIQDGWDSCPHTPNPEDDDNGGLNTSSIDGIGDTCQCGDVSDEGRITSADVEALERALLGDSGSTPVAAQKCNVYGPTDSTPSANGLPADCDLVDRVVLRRGLSGLMPGIAQVCQPAVPSN